MPDCNLGFADKMPKKGTKNILPQRASVQEEESIQQIHTYTIDSMSDSDTFCDNKTEEKIKHPSVERHEKDCSFPEGHPRSFLRRWHLSKVTEKVGSEPCRCPGECIRKGVEGKGSAKALRYESAWCIRGVARWREWLGPCEDRGGNRSPDLVRPVRSRMWVLSTDLEHRRWEQFVCSTVVRLDSHL